MGNERHTLETELYKTNERLRELDREYARLSNQHSGCHNDEDSGPCSGHGSIWANALNYSDLLEKKERLERAERTYNIDSSYGLDYTDKDWECGDG